MGVSTNGPEEVAHSARPGLDVAVVMRRRAVSGPLSRWQAWQWTPVDVVPNEVAFGRAARPLLQSSDEQRWLFPHLRVELFRDDAEGYHLNLVSPAPCWFVLWRLDEESASDTLQLARPVAVSLSYHDAGRWLDAQESVDQLPADPDVVEWLQAFASQHYQPEPRRRRRPQSFQALTDRFGKPASVSTSKTRGEP
ncbi:DUF3305 domain-containing protein [Simplicispira suum]|uniref:DUF3305 domain-containing protein n=1 Tax=Simplicispira suum TaxID=2109915 RepID=A0A2S0MWS0_9BURK|nr:DUF3305 domain-containing protein [Simplicispira suum]AVO40328.1 DUF3305 domain-containing protein [Simplicispira suum]MBW7833375.1 DUF3305 domain-containing protein [Simplicispira suum]